MGIRGDNRAAIAVPFRHPCPHPLTPYCAEKEKTPCIGGKLGLLWSRTSALRGRDMEKEARRSVACCYFTESS